ESRRADVGIDARNGAKVVTSDLLRKVEVKYNQQLVRSYEFFYRPGAFQKTLLQEIVQYGSDNRVFNRHQFKYDQGMVVADGYQGFGSSRQWLADAADHSLYGIKSESVSLLGAGAGRNSGIHSYVGYNPSSGRKQGSFGVKVGSSSSDTQDVATLIDINGDGLPDRVFEGSDGVYYQPNQSGATGSFLFGTVEKITGLPSMPRESASSTTKGFEAYLGIAEGIANQSTTYTTGEVYFSDVNSDGLPDLVDGRNGDIYYNCNQAGKVVFVKNDSRWTEVNIPDSGLPVTDKLKNQIAEFAKFKAANAPLVDAVRQWAAPKDGQVNLIAPVKLAEFDAAAYPKADGVRVAIQHNDKEVWSKVIAATDHNIHNPGVLKLELKQGDYLYFRVGSINNGDADLVEWDPEIQYYTSSSGTSGTNLAETV
ncbi:MAG TPA: sugar-binding protein, partial [Bacillota bacterium]|nr:sugar-binding protein [Bacillota bacterium]